MTPKFAAVYKTLHLHSQCKFTSIFSRCQENNTYCCCSKLAKNVSGPKGLEGIHWGRWSRSVFYELLQILWSQCIREKCLLCGIKSLVWPLCPWLRNLIEWYCPGEQSTLRTASLPIHFCLRWCWSYPGSAYFQLLQLEGSFGSAPCTWKKSCHFAYLILKGWAPMSRLPWSCHFISFPPVFLYSEFQHICL